LLSGFIEAASRRVALGIRRRWLTLPPVQSVRSRNRIARQKEHGAKPIAHPILREVSEKLESEAIVPMARARLRSLLDEAAAVQVDELIRKLNGGWTWPCTDLLESDDVCRMFPEVYKIGLSDKLLDLAENYLGERCVFSNCNLTRQPRQSSRAGTQLWHTDIEDDRMVRILIYLNDVSPGGGAFEYLSASDTAAVHNYRPGYLQEEVASRSVPERCRRHYIAEAGSAVVFDGTRVLHRAGLPTSADRFSLSLTYTSRAPRYILPATRLKRGTRDLIWQSLSERQRQAMP